MYITGLGEVTGLAPNTIIHFSAFGMRVKDLDDQKLSLYVPLLLKDEPMVGWGDDNTRLRARLKKLNPELVEKLKREQAKADKLYRKIYPIKRITKAERV